MPDTGGFESGNHEHDDRAALPGGWDGAFAALPLEGPDAGGWQRVQSRLPGAAPVARRRWPLWLATAASMAVAVTIPMRLQPGSDPTVPSHEVATAPAVAARTAPVGPRIDETRAAQTPAPVSASAVQKPGLSASTTRAMRNPRIAPAQRPIRTLAPPAGATRVAAGDMAAELEPLYAQSAQLEGLLALARDDRVASGPVAALTDGLDAEVASIDAALVQQGLSSQRRSELWGERVDALRQLVGVQATQRLLAARGQQYDAALVSID